MSRGKQQLVIFFFGFIIGAILLAGGYFLYNRLVDSGKIQSVSLPIQTEDVTKKAMVLVSLQRIEKGDELKPESFQLVERNLDEVPANSIIDIGMITGERAAFIIEAKEVLTESKLLSVSNNYNPDDRLKDYALQGYLVADTVKAGDFIDVEMVRTNGDTFIVLAKKQVIELTNNKAIIQVSTAERSLINHAIAEQAAGLGHIESLLYLDEKQPASQITYIPSKITTTGTQAAAEPVKSVPLTTVPVTASAETTPASAEETTPATTAARRDTKTDTQQNSAAGKLSDTGKAQGGKIRQ